MKTVLRILIVEDSEDDALLELNQIRKGGYDIDYERVDSVEKMKTALKEKTWDIILSDYKMPRFNGLEALMLLKKSGIDIPFIVISGTIGEAVAVEMMKAGAHDYLMKNNLQRLLPAVERELRESNNRVERKLLEQEQKQAEKERLDNLHFFESMDRVNRDLQGINDLENMMSDVLETTLLIFDCDRAWLLYPCDPDAPSFRVSMEITKPEYPDTKVLNVDIPISPDEARNMREALESDMPVTYTAGTERPISAKEFGVQSQMFVPLYPKSGKPWVFGMHQCSYPRVWTQKEIRLFQDISRRLSDALSSLLIYRDLCKSEAENRAIVNAVPDLLFRVRKDGIIADFRKPEKMELYVPPDKFLGKTIIDTLPPSVSKIATSAIEDAFKTKEIVTFEYDLMMKDRCTYFEGRVIALSNDEVLIVVRDISDRKQAEIELVHVNRTLLILSDTNQALIHITDEATLLNETCRIIVEVGNYRMAWVGFAEHDEARTLRPVAHAGFEVGYIEAMGITWADETHGQDPSGTAIRTGQLYIVHDIPKNPECKLWREAAMQRGYQSLISLPLITDEKTFGTLNIYAIEANAFDVKEVEILKELADDLAFGITSLRIKAKKNQIEEALSESEERFRLIAENTADTITVLDMNLNTKYISPSIIKLRGYTVQESITQSLDQILTPESLQKANKIFAEQIALASSKEVDTSRTVLLELEEYRKDGSIIWVEIAVSFIRDVNLKPARILTVTRDITERMQAEEKLRILSRAVEQSPVSIVITNINGIIEYVNSKFTEVTGYSQNEMFKQNPRILKSGEMSTGYYKDMWQTITSGKEWYGEFHNKKKNGELYWELASISPIFDTNGTITHFLAVKEDITQRKQTEKELIKAKEKAEESDHLKTSFLCNMSHEIRTPMNAIVGFSQLLNDPDISADKKQRFSNIIKERSYDLLRIVEDILDISKIEVGQMHIIDSDVNIENMLNELLEYYMLKIHQSETEQVLSLNYSLDNNLKNDMIRTDGQRLKQILNNFLDNAFKFTKKGSIEFGCKMNSTSELLFFVKDTGIGIQLDKQKIIFDRFRQAEDSIAARSYGGTGLGLSIAKSLITLMNGKVWLESQVGIGTTFYFTLPFKLSVKNKEFNYVSNNNDYKPPSWRNKIILIVEDDKANSEYLNEILSSKGFQILMAYTGEEALQVFKNNSNIDLVLMDVRLPDTNGLNITRIIKKINPKIIVLAQTAYAFSNDMQDCVDAGCSDYISKPINYQKLISLIDHYLG